MSDAIRKLIERLAPAPARDDCVTDQIDLSDRQAASMAALELAGTSRFERRAICILCGIEKLTKRRA